MVANLLVRVLLHTLHDFSHDIREEGHELTGSLFGHDSRLARQRDRRVLKGGQGSEKREVRVLFINKDEEITIFHLEDIL